MAIREDELVSSPRPKARPDAMMGGNEPQAREASGGGGKGGQAESQEQITNSMNDKKWGYFDPYTGKKVPWFIDMINGGGKDKAGEKFEGGFGAVGLAGGLMNMLGIDPYGQSRERTYGGGDFYRGGELDPSLLYQFGGAAPAPAPAGGGGGAVADVLTYGPQNGRGGQRVSREDRLMGMPVQAMSAEDRLMGMPVQANPLYAQAAAEAGMGLDPFGYPKSPETMQQAPLQSGFNQIGSSASNLPSQSLIDAAVSRGTSGGVPNNYAEGIFGAGVETRSPTIQQNERLTKFNQLTSTIPQPLMGTQAAQMYVDAVINGQTMLSFKDFFGQNFR